MLTPEGKMGLALTTGVMVFGTFQLFMPSTTDVRTVEAGNADVQSAERAATWTAAVLVSGIALMTKSPEVFTVGGVITVGMAWGYRHADQVSPITKKATGFFTAESAAKAQMPAAPAATQPTPAYASVI